MLKPLSICGKIQKIYVKNACITCNKCCITTKFGTKVAHAKENFEIFTDVRDSDVIMLKFERFHETTPNLVGLLIDSCCFHFYSQNWKKFFSKCHIWAPLIWSITMATWIGLSSSLIVQIVGPLINEKGCQVWREKLFLFLSYAGETAWGADSTPPQ